MKKSLYFKILLMLFTATNIVGCANVKNKKAVNEPSAPSEYIAPGACFDGVKDYISLDSTKTNDEPTEEQSAYERAVIDYDYDNTTGYWEKGIFSAGYTGAAILQFLDGKPSSMGSGINSILAALSLWGLNGHTGDPTIQDVLEKLETMDKKIDDLSSKLNAFAQEVQSQLSYITYGIQQQRYDDFKRDWDNYVKDYIDEMDNIIRDFHTKYREEFSSLLVDNTNDYYTLRVSWAYDEDQLETAIANPNNPYKTVTGSDVKKSHLVKIPMSYLKPLIDQYNVTHSYSEDLEETLKTCIDNYLKDSPRDNAKVNSDQIYASIVNEIILNIADKETARTFNNLFINFANRISGDAGTSILDAYFTLMDYYYNFQSEAEDKLQSFRAKLKESLSTYFSFNSVLRVYSFSDIDVDEGLTALINASDKIKERTNLRDTYSGGAYSYVIGRNIRNQLVKLYWKVYYSVGNFVNSFYCEGVDSAQWVNTILGLLVSKSYWDIMLYRYKNIASRDSSVPNTFTSYLMKYACLENNALNRYSTARTNNGSNGTSMPNCTLPVICGYDGDTFGLSSEDFVCRCIDGDNQYYNYFHKDTNYHYKAVGEKKDAGEKYWSGGEAKGTVIDIGNNNKVVTTVLDRWARYEETYWLWTHDEKYAFRMYGGGLYCYAFFLS